LIHPFLPLLLIVNLLAADAPLDVKVSNPSFEQLNEKTGMPVGWHGNTRAVMTSDEIVFSDGERSVGIIFCGALQDATYYTSVVPDAKAATYRVTADVRLQDFDGWIALQSQCYPQPQPRFRTKLRAESVQSGWQEISLDIKPKNNTTRFSLFFVAYGTWGRVWVDNVRIQKVADQ